MPYTPPPYEELHNTTANLQQTFNAASYRYTPPTYETLQNCCRKMEEKYREKAPKKARAYYTALTAPFLPDPINPKRLEEISGINRLLDVLPKSDPGTSLRNQVQNILLGALIYRLFAIKSSYTDTMTGYALTFMHLGSEKNSILFQTIEEILEIKVGNELDPLSVFTCCSALRQYLREQQMEKECPYFRRDEETYLTQLDDIIAKAHDEASSIIEQINQLSAIQAIAQMIRKTEAELCPELASFNTALSHQLKSKEELSHSEILACIPKTLTPRVSCMMSYLVPDDMKLTKKNIHTFLPTMNSALMINSQYTVLGAYIIVLNERMTTHPLLSRTLNSAIDGLRLDNLSRQLAFHALKNYMDFPDMERDFDFSSWTSYGALQSKLIRQTTELKESIALEQVTDIQLTS